MMLSTHKHKKWLWLVPLLLAAFFAFEVGASKIPPSQLKKRQARMEVLYQAMDDSLTQFIKPNLVKGKQLFLDNCFACHGQDGKRVDFDYGPAVRYLGTTANDDIELFWAMASFGDDTRGMGAFEEELSAQELLDISAFVRTLPVK